MITVTKGARFIRSPKMDKMSNSCSRGGKEFCGVEINESIEVEFNGKHKCVGHNGKRLDTGSEQEARP